MCTSMSVLCRAALRSSSPASVHIFTNMHVPRFNQGRNALWLSATLRNSDQKSTAESFMSHRGKFSSVEAANEATREPLTEERAKNIVASLKKDERSLLLITIQKFQSQELKLEYEGQLAAFRWRSRFGRPSQVPSLGDVDPTGSYCAVPDDWLLRKYAESVPKPTAKQLAHVFTYNAFPFVFFGFLDNSIMIIAGDYIEAALGSFIVVSTMAAAALGNTVSDIAGIGLAFYVELLVQKLGWNPPNLTPIQLQTPLVRRFSNMGRVMGVTLGCILGMSPLLLHNEDKTEKGEKGKNKENGGKNDEEI